MRATEPDEVRLIMSAVEATVIAAWLEALAEMFEKDRIHLSQIELARRVAFDLTEWGRGR